MPFMHKPRKPVLIRKDIRMNFVFISPNFPEIYSNFCVCLRNNGINVLGIGDAGWDDINPDLKECLTEYYRVDSMENYDQMIRAIGHFTAKYGKIDWIESNNEYWLETDAALRTDFNVCTGMKIDEIAKIRSKSLMKQYYAQAGIKTARWALVTDKDAARAFIAEVGYPVVVKPDRGVGAEATFKLKTDEDLDEFFAWYETIDTPYLMEEFVTGEVTTFDGVCNSEGRVLFAASHITPTSIMDMANEGKPCYYYVNKEVAPDIREAGKKVLKAFDVRSRAFHLEFFRLTAPREGLGEKGDIVGLEVNMRPAGGFTVDMLNFSQSADMYQIWADMVAFDESLHEYSGPHHYCCYVGRRDIAAYTYSISDVANKYQDSIYEMTRMPEGMAGLMGDQVVIACFDTHKEMNEFINYTLHPTAAIPEAQLELEGTDPEEYEWE